MPSDELQQKIDQDVEEIIQQVSTWLFGDWLKSFIELN